MHVSCGMNDPELLRRLYVDEGLSARGIGAMLGCSGATILRRLRRLGVDVRLTGPVPHSRARSIGIAWSPEIAYALGLMATDGNLSRRRGQLSLVSKDLDQIETLRRCLQLEARISRVRSSTGFLHKVQWYDRGLYDWFLRVGLTPAKSRTLGPLAVPDEPYADFFRGCIDGDGSVLVYTDRYHATKNPSYVYERLYVSLVSASRPFLEWIQANTRRLAGVSAPFTIAAGEASGRFGPFAMPRGNLYECSVGCTTVRTFHASPVSASRPKGSFLLLTLPHRAQLDDPDSGGCTLCQLKTRAGVV
jgi:hypothetical protein